MDQATKTKTLILAGILLLSATVAHAGGRCFNAEIPKTLLLPDGSTHAPGSLRLCMEQNISPTSNIHRGESQGRTVGMFLSAPRHIEMSVEEGQSRFVFREIDDELLLVGYAVATRDGTIFFDMSRFETKRAASRYAIPNSEDDGQAVVLIAGL